MNAKNAQMQTVRKMHLPWRVWVRVLPNALQIVIG